jgi:predicted O-methyltransferase YrrM
MSCPAHALAASRGMLCSPDVDLIRELVGKLPRNQDVVVVDLGAGSGTTALAVFAERANRIHVTSVDRNPDNLRWAGAAVRNIQAHRNWSGRIGKSWEIPADQPLIDLLLCDASHEYASVLRDLKAWLPHVVAGGLVWVHDYGPPGRYPGVKSAIEELLKVKKLLRMRQSGWGWAGKKI